MCSSATMLCNSPETVQKIRGYFDLDKPGKMDEAVTILEDWIKMQNHFRKKDFNRHFLEMMIIQSKGSLERAKNKLDKYCTLRSMMPKYFQINNPKTDFEDAHEAFHGGLLPKLAGDYYRVCLFKVFNKNLTSAAIMEYYKISFMAIEYILAEDYFNGMILVLDYTDVNMSDVLAAINPVELSDAVRLITECFGLRLKGFHLITPSKLINGLVKILQQFLSPKLAERIYVHKDYNSLFEVLPREAFPKDYGGEEKPIKAIRDEWLDILASEKCMKYMQEMKKATINEEYRDKYEFNSKYMGLPGTFRSLSLD